MTALKLSRIALALLMLPSPAWAVTYIGSDPTGGANGTSYADMVTFNGTHPDSTIITVPMDLKNRQFVRFSNVTIMGSIDVDSLSHAVMVDSFVVKNGGIGWTYADSCSFRNGRILNGTSIFCDPNFDSPADTLRRDWWAEADTFSNIYAQLFNPRKNGCNFRGIRSLYWSAVQCTIRCPATGSEVGSAKFFTVQRSKFLNSSWRSSNYQHTEESGYWCIRDQSAYNQFSADTVWQNGPLACTLAPNHSGNCGNVDWCDQYTGNIFDRCWFVNLSPIAGDSRILFNMQLHGDQFTNNLFLANGDAAYLQVGIRDTESPVNTRFDHNTFVSLGDGRGVVFGGGEANQMLSGVFKNNLVYVSKQYVTGKYASALHLSSDAVLDTLDYNLYYRTYPDSTHFVQIPGMTWLDYRSNAGPGTVFTASTGYDVHSAVGSPRFTDSTATYHFNPIPVGDSSFAVGSRWPDRYVGAFAPVYVDSAPHAADTMLVATIGTRVYANFSIPRDDHGIVQWDLYRSTTDLGGSYEKGTRYVYDFRKRANEYYQGQSIDVSLGHQKTGVTWYYWLVFTDTGGQVSTAYKRTITTSTGGSGWSWPP